MKLTAYLINTDKVGVDITSWGDDTLLGNVPFKFEETVSSGYADITTVENIHKYGFDIEGYDYKKVRNIIKDLVETIGFSNLTANEKYIATIHKIGTHAERLSALNGNVENLVLIGLQYHVKVSDVRKIRLGFAVAEVHNRLGFITIGPYTAAEIILSEILPYNYLYTFTELGLGGLCDNDNSEGLFDYLNSTVGSTWELTGLRSKPWTPEGMTDMEEFCDKMLDILQNGNY